MLKRIICNGLAIGMLLVLASFCWAPASWSADKKMPAFSLAGLGDSPQVISSENYKGKVLLVNFWATWCPPCRREIPSLVRIHEENNKKNFTVIGISMDKSKKEKVDAFVKKIGVTYPVGLGNNDIARSFGALGAIPSSFLIDENGVIVKKYPGYTTYEKMAKDVQALID